MILRCQIFMSARASMTKGDYMKKIVLIIAILCVSAALLFILQVPQKTALTAGAAQYLREKYGNIPQAADCVYVRLGYTESHRDILGNGTRTDYQDCAVFGRGEDSITVQRRDGAFCDDGQAADLGYIIAEHFSEKCGVEITFAELHGTYNGNIFDSNPTWLLCSGGLLDKDNVEQALLDYAHSHKMLELALYVPDKYADLYELHQKLTDGLSGITASEGFSRVRYFVYAPDEELIVNRVNATGRDKDSLECRALDFPYYYAAVPQMHSDFDISGTIYYGMPTNTVTAVGEL